jgi:hypothetical protein
MVDYSYKPRLDFNWTLVTSKFRTPREKLNRQEAQQWAKRIDNAVAYTKTCMKQAQERQAKQVNKKWQVPDFSLEDKVYVIKKTWKTDKPLNKLDYPLAGPFKILSIVRHSYCLKLPTSYKIWPIFYADKLRKDLDNLLLNQVNFKLKAGKVNSELE